METLSFTDTDATTTQQEIDKNGYEIDYSSPTPRFSVNSAISLQEGLEYLNENGYAVFSDVLTEEEVKTNKNLFWDFLEQAAHNQIDRDKHDTWDNHWPARPLSGVISQHGIGQSKFLWNVRNNRNVKKIFSNIWQTDELLVSFDGAGCFRDWSFNQSWKTEGGWIHVDQHPVRKPNKCCIQGLVAITDNDEFTGGLVVYPKSQKRFLELTNLITPTHSGRDFVKIPPTHQILRQSESSELIKFKLVKCKAGDLVVWDSRVIHCNTPAIKLSSDKTKKCDLLRAVAYVSMSPTAFVSEGDDYKTLDKFRKLRKEAVMNNTTTSHWSQDLIIASEAPNLPKFSMKDLNSYQRSLIIGTNVANDND
ncbi:unnamed protein product [Didymodactylos carnosus]|uniref:Phytanoyl-CoA dioxygenase n=1 Tax=Didymodactylos carnosus TaxID=1234261 RepID=A0A815BG76_9BILA|nr:unnamed protein product [Didymodactylos carnosus]CAF1267127.1 unnamed protein product [Didymodactylos carnosus]CAF3838553.1 unnamed protein product [Didymodactylos carnosus]CAF4051449.1 unnamed protein product [Didymodactylos carnosus]